MYSKLWAKSEPTRWSSFINQPMLSCISDVCIMLVAYYAKCYNIELCHVMWTSCVRSGAPLDLELHHSAPGTRKVASPSLPEEHADAPYARRALSNSECSHRAAVYTHACGDLRGDGPRPLASPHHSRLYMPRMMLSRQRICTYPSDNLHASSRARCVQ